MKLSYYMRGLGTGIVVTALIMGIALGNAKPAALTEAEIKAAAEKLGMVESGSLKLSDLPSSEGSEEPGDGLNGTPDGAGESPDGTPEPGNAGNAPDRTPEEEGQDTPSAGASNQGDDGNGGTPEPGESGGVETGDAENAETPSGTSEVGDDGNEEPSGGTPGENVEPPEPGEAGDAPDGTPEETGEPGAGGGTGNAGTASPEAAAEPDSAEKNGSSSSAETYTITVTRGSGSRAVCKQLEEQGLIEDAGAFDQYLIDNGYSKRISVGTYEIEAGADWERIAKIITKSR